MKNSECCEKKLIEDYVAAVYGCIGQKAFEEEGRQWNRDSFREVAEHPINKHPDLLKRAMQMLEATVGHSRRGRAVLDALASEQ